MLPRSVENSFVCGTSGVCVCVGSNINAKVDIVVQKKKYENKSQ